jgi:hypothetical protein
MCARTIIAVSIPSHMQETAVTINAVRYDPLDDLLALFELDKSTTE